MSKEDPKAWTNGRTNSFIVMPHKSNAAVESDIKRRDSTKELARLSSNPKRTKSIDVIVSNTASPPKPRTLETSMSDRPLRRELSNNNTPLSSKTHSSSCIALTNYQYPVVNVFNKEEGGTEAAAPPEQSENDAQKARKRENLRKHRDNLNWNWTTQLGGHNNGSGVNNVHSTEIASTPAAAKGADVEGLMHKAWAKQYKEGELFVSGIYSAPNLIPLHI